MVLKTTGSKSFRLITKIDIELEKRGLTEATSKLGNQEDTRDWRGGFHGVLAS